MSLNKVILDTLEHYKDANLASEAAREKIKHDIILKYLEEVNNSLVDAEKKMRENAARIFFGNDQKVN